MSVFPFKVIMIYFILVIMVMIGSSYSKYNWTSSSGPT